VDRDEADWKSGFVSVFEQPEPGKVLFRGLETGVMDRCKTEVLRCFNKHLAIIDVN
jgi:hypothetical protein